MRGLLILAVTMMLATWAPMSAFAYANAETPYRTPRDNVMAIPGEKTSSEHLLVAAEWEELRDQLFIRLSKIHDEMVRREKELEDPAQLAEISQRGLNAFAPYFKGYARIKKWPADTPTAAQALVALHDIITWRLYMIGALGPQEQKPWDAYIKQVWDYLVKLTVEQSILHQKSFENRQVAPPANPSKGK